MNWKSIKKDLWKSFDIYILLTSLLIIIGIVISWWYIDRLYDDGIIFEPSIVDIEGVGQFGDFIGGVVGSLWSLAAVILIYRTYSLQKVELDALRKHNDFQKFQTSFFELLSLNGKAIDTFTYHRATGHEAFQLINKSLFSKARKELPNEMKKTDIFRILMSENLDHLKYPIHLLMETIYLVENQEESTQTNYFAILSSIFTTDMKFYLYNLAMASYQEVKITAGFYRVINPLDIGKILSISPKGELQLSERWKQPKSDSHNSY